MKLLNYELWFPANLRTGKVDEDDELKTCGLRPDLQKREAMGSMREDSGGEKVREGKREKYDVC